MGSEVAEMVRERTAGPAIFVGLSLGGCVAQALAVYQPELVRGLGLVDTTCWYGETAKADWEARAEKAMTDGLDSLAAFQLARWFTPEFLGQRPEVAQHLLQTFKSMRLDAYVATCEAMGAMDLREQIGSITVPTAVLVGADDPATPVRMAEELQRRIAGASLHVMADCSHLSAVEQPEVVARLLSENLFARL
jgi:3-oxoadipate enol-lactonase